MVAKLRFLEFDRVRSLILTRGVQLIVVSFIFFLVFLRISNRKQFSADITRIFLFDKFQIYILVISKFFLSI